MEMRSWEEVVFGYFRLATLVLAIGAVLLVEMWGLVKIWRLLRKIARSSDHTPDNGRQS